MTAPMTLWPAIHVFVYGTLRRGEQRDINRLEPAPLWLGRAGLAGTLYDLGDYPGLRLHTATADHSATAPQRVAGEVYAISPELERVLDEIEGVSAQPSPEYVRRHVTVQLDPPAQDKGDAPPATRLSCLVYEVARDRIARCFVIAGGDWVSYRQQRSGRSGLTQRCGEGEA